MNNCEPELGIYEVIFLPLVNIWSLKERLDFIVLFQNLLRITITLCYMDFDQSPRNIVLSSIFL